MVTPSRSHSETLLNGASATAEPRWKIRDSSSRPLEEAGWAADAEVRPPEDSWPWKIWNDGPSFPQRADLPARRFGVVLRRWGDPGIPRENATTRDEVIWGIQEKAIGGEAFGRANALDLPAAGVEGDEDPACPRRNQ